LSALLDSGKINAISLGMSKIDMSQGIKRRIAPEKAPASSIPDFALEPAAPPASPVSGEESDTDEVKKPRLVRSLTDNEHIQLSPLPAPTVDVEVSFVPRPLAFPGSDSNA